MAPGGSFSRLWDRFMTLNRKNGRVSTGPEGEYIYKAVKMEEFTAALESGELNVEDDSQLDEEDIQANRS